MSEIIILTLSPFIACLAYLAVVCWCDCLWGGVVAERARNHRNKFSPGFATLGWAVAFIRRPILMKGEYERFLHLSLVAGKRYSVLCR